MDGMGQRVSGWVELWVELGVGQCSPIDPAYLLECQEWSVCGVCEDGW